MYFGFLLVVFVHKPKGNEEKGRILKQAGYVLNLTERRNEIISRVTRQTSVTLFLCFLNVLYSALKLVFLVRYR